MTAALAASAAGPNPPEAPATTTLEPTGPPPVGRRERAALALGAVGLAAFVIGTRWGVFTPDTRPDLYQQPGAFLRSSLQAWVPGSTGLGQGNFNAGAAPVAAVMWVIRTLGAPSWLAVRIWRLALMLLGAWGIRRYLGGLLGHRLSAQARLLATVFWVVNPYVIVSGSTTPILLPYALLPWLMLAFLRATRDPRSWRWPALFGLGFFAQSGLNAGVVPFFQLLAIPAHLVHARWVERRTWHDLARVVWRCGACSFAVSLYWLLPSLLATGTGAGIAAATESPGDVARASSYAESARLLGNWPLYGRSGDRRFLGDYTVYLTSFPVVLASFLLPVGVAWSLWRSRARERLLVVVLLATALPVMVGLFPPDDRSPAGSTLAAIFERVPASLAFRTTNKVGAVVVLAETVALVLGWRAWQARSRRSGRQVRAGGVAMAAVVLLGCSAPLWTGGLYPLGFTVPSSWERATDDLDAGSDARVLVLPGGTGGNYRWGMRSPDDLFPSLLDRPVAVRHTVVGRGEPAGNMLSAFDTAVAQGRAGARGISTAARYLGADELLVRNDLLTEEIGGPAPSRVVTQADADTGLSLSQVYGPVGRDTVPGRSGPASRSARESSPDDAALHPQLTYDVANPITPVRVAPASNQVLVVGDGDALVPLANLGIIDGTQPLRFVGDLGDAEFAAAVRQGGRLVLTDTNRRRAWDINRTANATSATLTVAEDIDGGNGSTTTRWPDQPADQTVSQLPAGIRVGASRPSFGLHPFGRASNAFDGDPSTAWIGGGFGTAVGESVWIEFPEARRVEQITIRPYATEPSNVTALRVRVGSRQVIEAVAPGQEAVEVQIEPGSARRIEVTILGQTGGDNPVGISEIAVDGATVRNVTRAPSTLSDRFDGASDETVALAADLPLDVVLSRAVGTVGDPIDDEEAQLDRRFEIPDDRTLTFRAELDTLAAPPDLVQAAREGDATCERVAVSDEEWIEARIVSTRAEIADGQLHLEGCAPLELDAGVHGLLAVFGWRLDRVHLSSDQPVVEPTVAASAVRVIDRTATRVELEVEASGAPKRLLRIGEAFDERWTLEVDGVDAGPPILVDGYATGWIIDGDAQRMTALFGPQRAVEVTFVASAVAVVGVTALAVLPAGVVAAGTVRRRRAAPGPGKADDERGER